MKSQGALALELTAVTTENVTVERIPAHVKMAGEELVVRYPIVQGIQTAITEVFIFHVFL